MKSIYIALLLLSATVMAAGDEGKKAEPCSNEVLMETVREAYDKLAGSVPDNLGTTLQYMRQPVINFYDSLPPNQLVLDAGCGVGLEAEYALAKGHSVIGLDFSDGALAAFKARNPTGVPVKGSHIDIPLETDSVDVLASTLSIIHLDKENGTKAIREFARVLKKGGRFLIATSIADNEAWDERAERGFLQDRGIPFLYFYHWNKQSLFDTMRGAGFVFNDPTPLIVKEGRPQVVFMEGTLKK